MNTGFRPEIDYLKLMAERYEMDLEAFNAVVIQMCIPKEATREHLAAFLMVAYQYELNPLTREVYAFVKHGRLTVIVSVDGWMSLINRRPEFDGMEFVDHLDEKGELISVTCKIYRKDRSRPTEVTEYMVECRMGNDTPWGKWPRRLLRHKSAIQCSRYAFAISGIVDPDEAERIALDVSGGPVVEHKVAEHKPARQAPAAPKVIEFSNEQPIAMAQVTPTAHNPQREALPVETRQEPPTEARAVAATTTAPQEPARAGAQAGAQQPAMQEQRIIDQPEVVRAKSGKQLFLDAITTAQLAGEESLKAWQLENIGIINGFPDDAKKEILAAIEKAWANLIDFPGDRLGGVKPKG